MKLEIDINEKDIEALKKKVMTIDDMYNTIEGRVTCAIVHAASQTEKEYRKQCHRKLADCGTCYSCINYKDGFCLELGFDPCYPLEGCDYFRETMEGEE